MAYGYEKGFVIEKDYSLRKRVNCYDCEFAEKSDYSCIKKGVHFPSDGSSMWKTCDCFCLDKNADNYKVKNKYCNDVKKKHGEVLDKGIEMGGAVLDLEENDLKTSWLDVFLSFHIKVYLYCIEKKIDICKVLYKCEEILNIKQKVIDQICVDTFEEFNQMYRVLIFFGILGDVLGCSISKIMNITEMKCKEIIRDNVLPLAESYEYEGQYYYDEDCEEESVEIIIENCFGDDKSKDDVYITTNMVIHLTCTKRKKKVNNKTICRVGLNFYNRDISTEMYKNRLKSYVDTNYISEIYFGEEAIVDRVTDIIDLYKQEKYRNENLKN